MVKRGLFVLLISILFAIISVQFASALTSAEMYADCANRGGWIYTGTGGTGSSICSGNGMTCTTGYTYPALNLYACKNTASNACCLSTSLSTNTMITETGSCPGSCPANTIFTPAVGCTTMNPCRDGTCYSSSPQFCGFSGCNYPSWRCSCTSNCPSIGVRECMGTSGGYPTRRQCTVVYTDRIYNCAQWQTLPQCFGAGDVCYRGDCCTPTIWTPNSANYCYNQQITQTSNCGTTRTVYGTMPKVDGVWSAYGAWSACVGGLQTKTKACNSPAPQCGGALCSGPDTQTQTCCSNDCVPGSRGCVNSTTLGLCYAIPIGDLVCGNLTKVYCPYGCAPVPGSDFSACNACPSNWAPNPANYCTVENITQTDGCGNSRSVAGTKNCCKFKEARWNQTSVLFGDNVNMSVVGINCSDNENINFTVYNKTNFKFDSYNTTIVANKSVQEWSANRKAGNYSFNVTLASDISVTIKSNNLTVNMLSAPCGNGAIDTGEDCDNSASPIFRTAKHNCTEVDSNYIGGTLKCYNYCTFNKTGCTSGTPSVTQCSDYGQSPTNCGNDTYQVAQNLCQAGQQCSCYWNGTACAFSFTSSKGDCSYRCVKTVTSDGACDEATGMKSVVLDAKVVPLTNAQCTGITDCVGGTVEAPCGLVTADLPFFGWFNFVIALLAITIIYMYAKKIN